MTETQPRRLWYFLPGAKIVPADGCPSDRAATARYFCFEGDPRGWQPIAALKIPPHLPAPSHARP